MNKIPREEIKNTLNQVLEDGFYGKLIIEQLLEEIEELESELKHFKDEIEQFQLEELQQEIKSSIKQMNDGGGISVNIVRENIKKRRSKQL